MVYIFHNSTLHYVHNTKVCKLPSSSFPLWWRPHAQHESTLAAVCIALWCLWSPAFHTGSSPVGPPISCVVMSSEYTMRFSDDMLRVK